jgi:hypothetical protein
LKVLWNQKRSDFRIRKETRTVFFSEKPEMKKSFGLGKNIEANRSIWLRISATKNVSVFEKQFDNATRLSNLNELY